MHLHRICVFCHFKLRFGRCPQTLTVTGLCCDQSPIGNKLFDAFSNVAFCNVRPGLFPIRQAADGKLPSNARGNWSCAEQVSPFRSAGFQNGVVNLFGLFFQPLAVFFVCQVKAFPAQVCTKNAERSCVR